MSFRTKAHVLALVLLCTVVLVIMVGWQVGGAALLHRHARDQLAWDLPALISLVYLALGAIVGFNLFTSVVMLLRIRLATTGREISRAEAPNLWRVVDHWAEVIRAPRVDRIILTRNFGAAARVTRRWLVGSRKHALELGEPLLHLLTPSETEGVIVHELAHMRHIDHRDRLVIEVTHRLFAVLSTPLGAGHGPIGRVIERLRVRFFAEEMQQSRDQEFEADRVAAQFVGSETCARALIRLELGATRVMRRQQDVLDRLLTDDPLDDAIGAVEVAAFKPDPLDPDLLRMVLARHTLPDETHPSLSDRLRNVGIDLHAVSIPHVVEESESAAARWLGDAPEPGRADEGCEGSIGHHATAPEPGDTKSDDTELDVMRSLADQAEARLDPANLGSCLLLHLFLLRARAFTRVGDLLDRLASDPRATADVLKWVCDRSMHGSHAADAPRALLALSRLEDADPALCARALQQLADRRALEGRMTEAKATWRLVVRLRTRSLDPESWRESSLAPEDLGTADLDAKTFNRIVATFIRDDRVTGFWLASVHAALPLQNPRIVLALSARRSVWTRGRSLRELQRALAAVPGCHIELVDFDACSRLVQDRLRILGMQQHSPG